MLRKASLERPTARQVPAAGQECNAVVACLEDTVDTHIVNQEYLSGLSSTAFFSELCVTLSSREQR